MKNSAAGEKKSASGFGARIAELRQAAGLTMTGLAEKIGVSEAYVSMLESGGRRPSRKLIEKLVAVFEGNAPPMLRDQLLALAGHDPLSEAKKPAHTHYEHLLKQAPADQFNTFISLVNTLIRQGQFPLAQSRIEEGFRHFQKPVQLQMLVAYLELSRGNHDAGIVAMEAAIQAKTRDPQGEDTSMAELLLNLGVLHFFKGTASVYARHDALQQQDEGAGSAARKAALASFGKAREIYLQGLDLDPAHVNLRDELARVCFNLADLHSGAKAQTYWRESIDAFRRVLADPDKDSLEEDSLLESSCFLAHAYTKAGDAEAARAALALITACRPRHAFGYYVLACHHALNAQTDQALLWLQKALALKPALKAQARLEPDLEALRRQRAEDWRNLLA